METVYSAFLARGSILCGYRAPVSSVEALVPHLAETHFAPLLRLHRDLAVCRMGVRFALENGMPKTAGAPERWEYASGEEHDFYVTSPADILEDITGGARGEIAFRAGYLRIGMCAQGGDGYYLRNQASIPGHTPLYRVYYDWISYPDPGEPPVPPEAIHLEHESFEEILAVAEFQIGWMPE